LKSAHLDLRVEPGLVVAIDAWRNLHRLPPSRAKAIAYMLESWLKEHGSEPIVEETPRRPPRPR
jgi:hypothetical protein